MSTPIEDRVALAITAPRKLAEIWVYPSSDSWKVELRVAVGDWSAEMAKYAANESVKELGRAANAEGIEYAEDERLEPPGAV